MSLPVPATPQQTRLPRHRRQQPDALRQHRGQNVRASPKLRSIITQPLGPLLPQPWSGAVNTLSAARFLKIILAWLAIAAAAAIASMCVSPRIGSISIDLARSRPRPGIPRPPWAGPGSKPMTTASPSIFSSNASPRPPPPPSSASPSPPPASPSGHSSATPSPIPRPGHLHRQHRRRHALDPPSGPLCPALAPPPPSDSSPPDLSVQASRRALLAYHHLSPRLHPRPPASPIGGTQPVAPSSSSASSSPPSTALPPRSSAPSPRRRPLQSDRLCHGRHLRKRSHPPPAHRRRHNPRRLPPILLAARSLNIGTSPIPRPPASASTSHDSEPSASSAASVMTGTPPSSSQAPSASSASSAPTSAAGFASSARCPSSQTPHPRRPPLRRRLPHARRFPRHASGAPFSRGDSVGVVTALCGGAVLPDPHQAPPGTGRPQ